MLGGIQRWSRLNNLVRNSHQVRETCLVSLRNFPTAIANNEFNATAKVLADESVEIWILGDKVRLSVDFLIQNGDVVGIVLCEKINYEDKRTLFFQHYVEWNQVYADKTRETIIDSIESKSYPSKLLFQICEAIIAEHTVEVQNV